MLTRPGSYWTLSRAPRYSVTFALPLVILYEVLAATLSRFAGEQMRNGADVMLRSVFVAVAGVRGPLLFVLCVIGVSIWLIARDLRRGGKLESRVFLWMSVEAIALALVFGLVIGTVTARLLSPFSPLAIGPTQQHMGVGARLMLSLGAGLYEELLFRVLLVSGLLLLARRVLHWRPALANTFAVVDRGADLLGLPLCGCLRRSVPPRLVRVQGDRGRGVQRAVRISRLRHHGVDARDLRHSRPGILTEFVIPSGRSDEGSCVKYSWQAGYDDVTEGPSSLSLLGMTAALLLLPQASFPRPGYFTSTTRLAVAVAWPPAVSVRSIRYLPSGRVEKSTEIARDRDASTRDAGSSHCM